MNSEEQRNVPPEHAPNGARQTRFRNHRLYIRTLAIMLAALMTLYGLSIYVNSDSMHFIVQAIKAPVSNHAKTLADTLSREATSLQEALLAVKSDSHFIRLAIGYGVLPKEERLNAIRAVRDELTRIQHTCRFVDSVRVYYPSARRVVSTDSPTYAALTQESIYELDALKLESGLYPVEQQDGTWLCAIGWPSNLRYDNESGGFLLMVALSREKLERWLTEMRGENVTGITLTRDGADSLACSGESGLDWKSLCQSCAEETEPSVHTLNGMEYIVCTEPIAELDMTLITVAPLHLYQQPVINADRMMLLMTVFAICMIIVLAFVMWRTIGRPLNSIMNALDRGGVGEDYHIPLTGGVEFNTLCRRFNSMMDRTHRLSQDVMEGELRAGKAELKQLQYQIRPHFLYNNLYMLYRMAQQEHCDEMAEYTQQLSEFYRYITGLPDHAVPLAREIEHVEHYLAIQKFRFGDRVTASITPFSDELARVRVPPLILQPIVENAYEHGMKRVVENGVIELRIGGEPERFTVEVEDNGRDMTDEQLLELRGRLLNCDSIESISGLQNVQRRLILGGQGSINLSRGKMGGLLVTLTILGQR